MQRRFPATSLLARFSPVFFLCLFIFCAIYYSTFQRVSYLSKPPNSVVQDGDSVFLENVPEPNEKKDLKTSTIVQGTTPKESPDIWCKALEYSDLSSHPVFQEFNLWLHRFNEINCTTLELCQTHDPRILRQLVDQGIYLARTRRKIFEQIIRGDPRKAIDMAIPQNSLGNCL